MASVERSAERELVELERDWCRADIERDAAFFQRVLAEEFTAVGSRGGQDDKASYIEGLRDQGSSLTACEDRDVRVRIYGDVAVVTGLAVVSGVRGGVPYADRQVLFTNTYVLRDGRWQVVASQGTLVAAQQQ